MATKLEKVFDQSNWCRKFESQIPDHPTIVWREETSLQAQKFLRGKHEETTKVCRSLYLFTDSLGQALAIVEEAWD